MLCFFALSLSLFVAALPFCRSPGYVFLRFLFFRLNPFPEGFLNNVQRALEEPVLGKRFRRGCFFLLLLGLSLLCFCPLQLVTALNLALVLCLCIYVKEIRRCKPNLWYSVKVVWRHDRGLVGFVANVTAACIRIAGIRFRSSGAPAQAPAFLCTAECVPH